MIRVLVIDGAGNWSYTADNSQAAIQSLPAGATATETLTVTSVDGTSHNVTITIERDHASTSTAHFLLHCVRNVCVGNVCVGNVCVGRSC